MDNQTARAALDAAQHSDLLLAERAHWPLWRHAIAGGLQAFAVLCWGMPTPIAGVGIVLAVASIYLIMASDRKQRGFFVSGFSSAKAMPAGTVSLICVLGAYLFLWFKVPINTWSPLVALASLLVLIGVTLCSLWWESLYRAELKQGAK